MSYVEKTIGSSISLFIPEIQQKSFGHEFKMELDTFRSVVKIQNKLSRDRDQKKTSNFENP